MSYNVANNTAQINGKTGPKGPKAKGINYGINAAYNHLGYINSLKCDTKTPKPDVFTKNSTPEDMEAELKRLESETTPPLNFILRYAPKKNAISVFFNRLFKGHNIDTQALLGFSCAAMGNKQAMTIEEADAPFKDEAFKDIGAKLTTKAFDVNDDGKIDASEEAVSTVIADVLSKDKGINSKGLDIKKADGSYTNDGENKMMMFCNEENLEIASMITKDMHAKLGLNKAQKEFLKNN